MAVPVLTHELAWRIERSEAAVCASWMEGVPGCRVDRRSEATALLCPAAPGLFLFNRVLCLPPGQAGDLDDLRSLYAGHGLRLRVDVSPHQSSDDFLRALDGAQMRMAQFQTALYAAVRPVGAALPSGVAVSRAGPADMDAFIDIYLRGFGATPAVAPALSEMIRRLPGKAGWTLYLVRVDGAPAAIALLHVQDGVASLASAATLPEYRGRGCQSALLQARLHDAGLAGCDLVVSQTGIGTTSQHNMQRAGLQVAYTKSVWLQRLG